MQKILLLAHDITLIDKQKFVTLKYLKMALSFLEITDTNAKKFIYEFFNINPDLLVYPRLTKIDNTTIYSPQTICDSNAIKFMEELSKEVFPNNNITQYYTAMPFEEFLSNGKFDNAFEDSYEEHQSIFLSTNNTQKEKNSEFSMNRGINLLNTAIKIKKSLSNKLYGQNEAIESISDSIKNNILANNSTPKNTYLFLGPPATGKTYLAELLSEYLLDYKLKRFDMTQYTHQESGGYLYGTARFWGNAKPGSLTSFVRKNPKSIIILDEFEKANNIVQTNLLSIFAGGILQDACGWCEDGKPWGSPDEKGKTIRCPETEIDDIVDFKQSIFIITSNLGKELYSDSKFTKLRKENSIQAESMIIDALKREKKDEDDINGKPAIIPELVSRLSQANIVLFNSLTYQAFESIADKAFQDYKEAFCRSFNIEFDIKADYNPFLKTQILCLAPELDARRVKSKIGINFFDKVTDYFMTCEEKIPTISKIIVSVSQNVKDYLKENIDVNNEKLLHELFRKNLSLKVVQKFSCEDNVVTCHIESCTFSKVIKIKDYSDDGLVFDIPEISFENIAGHKMAKIRLKETIKFLKYPKYLKDFKINAPKGMLLYGPPGTGKTLLAKAFASEANLPFIAITGSDLLEHGKIESVFKKAKEYAPSIVFIDEIDAIGSRDANFSRDSEINQLIAELDGFSSNIDDSIFVIAATNYKEKIDKAILRPGRIELHIQINALDKEARKYFLQNIIDTKPVSGEFDIDRLLMYTTGMTGAELELIGKESSIYCIRNNLNTITQDILLEQINIIKYGEKIQPKNLDSLLESTAIHEAGHAILHKLLIPHVRIEQITVIPRENTLGFVSFNNEDNISNLTIEDIQNKIIIAFGGRLSQIKKYGKLQGMDTGASDDLNMATHYAYLAITKYGMDEDLGYINLDQLSKINNQYYSAKIDAAVQRWLTDAQKKAENLINTHWEKIEKLAQLLLEKEVVFEEEIKKI